MKCSYFDSEGLWLKGNLHSHTTVSDGVYEPAEMAMDYRAHGYDFISMTDHNVFVSHTISEVEDLLLLPGVEHDLAYSRFNCIHVVGTGAAGKSETDYPCRKYAPEEMTDQELIDMMAADGQYVVLAHPCWSRMEPEEIALGELIHAVVSQYKTAYEEKEVEVIIDEPEEVLFTGDLSCMHKVVSNLIGNAEPPCLCPSYYNLVLGTFSYRG